MAKSSSTPPATLHPTNIRQSSRLQSTSSQPSTSLSKCKTTKKQNSLTPVTEQNPGGDTMKLASSPNVSYLLPLYPVVDPLGKSSVMSILTKVITMSSGLEVVSEGGNSMVPIATDLNTASDEEMGKDMGKDLDVNNEGGNDVLSTATAPKAASEVAMGKFLPNLDIDSEGGNKELPLLPTAIAANAALEAAMGNTIPTATAPTTPISTDPIAGLIFQEGDISKVHQTLASNYIPDALAKLKATSHKYFSKEGLYISPRNDGNLDPIPYSYEKGYSKNRSTFVNMAPSDLKGSFTELKQFIDDGPNILTSSTRHLATANREEGLLQLPATKQLYASCNGIILGMSLGSLKSVQMRDMIAQNISKETLLTANDYFTGDMEITIDQDEERRCMMMVTRNITRLNELAARSNRKQRFVLMSINVDSYDCMSVEERMGII
ncbi:hypothetical protein BDQ17DRAFT_1500448 [Cyathus striatus]|nr:hypothetical protein BDQ17DRAFT_1500448 [Cyathus striatus]